MAQEENREAVLGEIETARRKGLLRLSIESEKEKHYSEAMDGYRQIIDEYFGTPEVKEAKKRMLDLAYLFEKQGEPYQAKHLYWLLEQLYTPQTYGNIEEKRRARVEEILDNIHAKDLAEEKRQAKLEESE